MSSTCVTVDDFNQILELQKRTVSYSINTKTTDPMTGSEISTFATASNKDVIFFVEEQRYMFDTEGLTQVGDAYLMAPTSIGIKRYDKFSIDGETFYIENVIKRYVMDVYMFDYGVCFKVT